MRRAFLTALASLLLASILVPAHAAYETGGVAKTILSNGVTILMRKEPEARIAAIEVFVRIGAEDEGVKNAGMGQLLAGAILSGTETRSALKLARLISEVGGNFHAVWQPNYLEISAVTLPDMADDTISLLADSVVNSSFDARAVDYSRNAILKEVGRTGDDAFSVAYTAVRHVVLRGSAFDRPYLGDPARVKAISREELKAWYERNLSADHIVVAVVGNMDMAKVSRKIEVCFGSIPRHTAQSPESAQPTPVTGETRIEKTGSSAYVMIGYPAPGVQSPDYPAMCVANVLLGANKSSLLFRNVREQKGLGYQVGSLYPDIRGPGHIAAYLSLDAARATPEVLDSVKSVMLAQVETLRAGGFADDDLERAKRYLIGNHALEHERTRDRAFHIGRYEAIGLGYQFDFTYGSKVTQVTREQVQDVCARYLKNPSIVTLTTQQPRQ
jgi:zinc protease